MADCINETACEREARNWRDWLWKCSEIPLWFSATHFLDIRYYGTHNIPEKGAAILAPNHATFFDPVLISIPVGRRVNFLAVDKYLKVAFPGLLMKLYGVIPVREEGSAVEAFAKCVRVLESDQILGIFPEGGRSEDGELMEFKLGLGLLAIRSGAPVVPVTIVGGFEAWPKGSLLPRLLPMSVIYHPPLSMKVGKDAPRPERRRAARDVSEQVREAVTMGFEMVRRTVRGWELVK